MAAKAMEDLSIHALSHVYSAEKQLTKALPKLARASTNPDLAAAFKTTWRRRMARSSESIRSLRSVASS